MDQEVDVIRNVREEVIGLHDFFNRWFNGTISEDEFTRIEKVIDLDFEHITPGGNHETRDQLLPDIRDAYAKDSTIQMWVEDIEVKRITQNHLLATYYELHRFPKRTSKRITSALFKEDDQAPNKCICNLIRKMNLML